MDISSAGGLNPIQRAVFASSETSIQDGDSQTQSLDRVSDADSGQVYLANKSKDAFGLFESCVLGNGPGDLGVTRTYERDAVGRSSRLLTEQTPGGLDLSDLQYTFDLASNILAVREMAGPVPRGNMQYEYDELDRLSAAHGTTMSGESAGVVGSISEGTVIVKAAKAANEEATSAAGLIRGLRRIGHLLLFSLHPSPLGTSPRPTGHRGAHRRQRPRSTPAKQPGSPARSTASGFRQW